MKQDVQDGGVPSSSLGSVRGQCEDSDLRAEAGFHPILLYDGVCGLCSRSVQFLLRRDRAAVFRFASLQSPVAAGILTRHSTNPTALDTVYVVINFNEPDEAILQRSEAVVFVLKRLGGFWRAVALLFQLFPRPLRDWFYRQVAQNRYRFFGRYESCPLPSADTRNRFLDA